MEFDHASGWIIRGFKIVAGARARQKGERQQPSSTFLEVAAPVLRREGSRPHDKQYEAE